MNCFAVSLFAVILAAGIPCQESKPASRPVAELRSSIDRLVAPLIDNEISVGLVVGVLRGDEMLVRGYGRIDKKKDARPDGDTVYEIGSISKVFTGILLADAIQRKLVKLDDPVTKHLPKGVSVPRFEDKVDNTLRLLHLATHTSGIPSMPLGYRSGNDENPYANYTEQRMWQDLPKARLPYAPGKKYAYSNFAMGVVGHIVTRVNGSKSYDELLADRLTGPIGLTSTKVQLNESMQKRLAPGYTSGGKPRINWDIGVLAGAGGIRSTVNEMLKFAKANLAPGKTPLAKAIPLSHEAHFHPKGGFFRRQPKVGLAWHHGTLKGVVRHSGQTGGYHACLIVHTKRNAAVVVLANSNSKKISELGQKVIVMACGGKPTRIAIRKVARLEPELLQKYAGRYRLNGEREFQLTFEDGALFARLASQPSWRLFPTSKTRFFYRVVTAEITFQTNDDDKVVSLTLLQNGRRQVAKRIEVKR